MSSMFSSTNYNLKYDKRVYVYVCVNEYCYRPKFKYYRRNVDFVCVHIWMQSLTTIGDKPRTFIRVYIISLADISNLYYIRPRLPRRRIPRSWSYMDSQSPFKFMHVGYSSFEELKTAYDDFSSNRYNSSDSNLFTTVVSYYY